MRKFPLEPINPFRSSSQLSNKKEAVSLGRIGVNPDAPAMKRKARSKPNFNASEGRDYTKDAAPDPVVKKQEVNLIIPEVKSPA